MFARQSSRRSGADTHHHLSPVSKKASLHQDKVKFVQDENITVNDESLNESTESSIGLDDLNSSVITQIEEEDGFDASFSIARTSAAFVTHGFSASSRRITCGQFKDEDIDDDAEADQENFRPASFNPTKRSLLCSLLRQLPPQNESDFGKLTVVLDLDETLVFAAALNRFDRESTKSHDCFRMTLSSGPILVRKRPFLDRFLRRAGKYFELILFTAGTEEYAERVLKQLDPAKKAFRHCLSREHCSFEQDKYMKDLVVVNRDLKRTVLVDNNPASFMAHQMANGILIRSFDEGTYHQPDNQLVVLYNFLKGLIMVADVRTRLTELNALTKGGASITAE